MTATPEPRPLEPTNATPNGPPSVGARRTSVALIVLAVLSSLYAIHWLKPILVPIALALILACLFSPITTYFRVRWSLGPIASAVTLFVLSTFLGVFIFIITANNLFQAITSLPMQFEFIIGKISSRLTETYRDYPTLRGVLPDPDAVDLLGQTNALLVEGLKSSYQELTVRMGEGVVVMTLVLFLLAETEILAPRVIRFFRPLRRDAQEAEALLRRLIHQVRAFLVARTMLNLGLGMAMAGVYWMFGLPFALVMGLALAVLNYIPYLGPILGGFPPILMLFATEGTLSDALLLLSVYIGVITVEGYVLTPWLMGRSLDLNGTTVLIACLVWWFLWGDIGLILAMPITAAINLVFQNIPSLHLWAELMSREWVAPPEGALEPSPMQVLLDQIDEDPETSPQTNGPDHSAANGQHASQLETNSAPPNLTLGMEAPTGGTFP